MKKTLAFAAAVLVSTAAFGQEPPLVQVYESDPALPPVGTQVVAPEDSGYTKAAKSYGGASGFSWEGIGFGVGAGALGGANAFLGYRIPYNPMNFWKNRLGFRVEYNTFKPFESMVEDQEIEIDGEKFTPHVDGSQFGALVDFYPFGYTWGLGGIRLSGGYYMGDFELGGNLHKEASGDFSIKDSAGNEKWYRANASADLSAYLDYEKIRGPYAGLGFDLGLFWGLKLYFDAGVVFTEKPVVSAEIASSGTIKVCNDSTCAAGTDYSVDSTQIRQMVEDLKREYEHELDSIRKGYFPMAKLGLMFRF